MQKRRAVFETVRAPTRRRGRLLLAAAVAGAVFVADQVTKTWALHHAVTPRHVLGPIFLTLTFNSGAAFGVGRGVTPVVEVVVVLLVSGLLLFGRRAARSSSTTVAVASGLLLGGACGNLADRLVRHHGGAVVDFIDALRIGSRDWWPVFNVADAAIVIGAIALVAIHYRPNRPPGG
jgi:signal peptidase II